MPAREDPRRDQVYSLGPPATCQYPGSRSQYPNTLSVNFAPSESVSSGSLAVSRTPTAPAVRSRHLDQFPIGHRPSVPRARLAGPALAGRPASRLCQERHVRSRAAFLRPSESLRVRGPPHAHLTSERDTGLRLPYLPAGSATAQLSAERCGYKAGSAASASRASGVKAARGQVNEPGPGRSPAQGAQISPAGVGY